MLSTSSWSLEPANGSVDPPRLSHFALSALLLLACAVLPNMTAKAGVGPTVKEVIEFTRIAQPANHDEDELQTLISPDRKQAVAVTRKADVATDVNTFEILLLDFDPEHLAAGKPDAPVSLLKVEARKDDYDMWPFLREVRWLDTRTLGFRARIHDEPYQAYTLDVATRGLKQLTQAPLGIVAFDVSMDRKRIAYVSPVLNPGLPPGASSLVVGTTSFWNVHFGHLGPRFQQRRYQGFVAEVGKPETSRPLGDSFAESNLGYAVPSISPDGRWVAFPRYEPSRTVDWAKQYPLIAQTVAMYTQTENFDPLQYFSRKAHYVPRQMILYRVADGHEQAIVDAPDDSIQLGQQRSDRLWQDGGRSVVIGGIFLPRAPGTVPSPAAHVIEYWPDSGKWKPIAALSHRLQGAYGIAGKAGVFQVVDGEEHRSFERGADGNWQEVKTPPSQVSQPNLQGGGWRLHIQQTLNDPPEIVAQGPTGASVQLTHLNPQFSPSKWGSMSPYSWTDAKDRRWDGGLMVPANFDPKRKYPLIIQTYGFSPTRFYRDGTNLYDGATSGFAGRAFLREGFLVLAMPVTPTTGKRAPDDYLAVVPISADGVRSAIDKLVTAGSVDRARVGILGWSATGEQVLNLVTFSDVPIRAATMLDGDSNTLYSMSITYGFSEGTQNSKDTANGGKPFGDSLQTWVRNDPSLHTDCIHAAMRIENYGPEVRNNWDVYALMRRQYKAAEMVVIPGDSHSLARPINRMISLQGNVDWYRFWLKDERRTELLIPGETAASLQEQYERWDQMKELKRIDDAKPVCHLLSHAG